MELTRVNYDVGVTRKVDVDELVDATQVAEMLELSSRNAVSVYRHRYADFPVPMIERGTCVLWARGDVAAWARRRRASR